MPLHGLDDLPNDVKRLIEARLSAKDQKSLALARQFSQPIQTMIDNVKALLKDLESVRKLRDDFYAQRKKLKAEKLELLSKDSKLKSQFDSMAKTERAKLLDSLGDQFDKGQLAYLKQAIGGLDRDITRMKDALGQATQALAGLKQTQQMLFEID